MTWWWWWWRLRPRRRFLVLVVVVLVVVVLAVADITSGLRHHHHQGKLLRDSCFTAARRLGIRTAMQCRVSSAGRRLSHSCLGVGVVSGLSMSPSLGAAQTRVNTELAVRGAVLSLLALHLARGDCMPTSSKLLGRKSKRLNRNISKIGSTGEVGWHCGL